MSAFRAGDVVHNALCGEDWVLACDEENGKVMPSGWPMVVAETRDCTLLEVATDEKRLETLKAHAATGRGHEAESDWRTVTARRQLEKEKQQKAQYLTRIVQAVKEAFKQPI